MATESKIKEMERAIKELKQRGTPYIKVVAKSNERKLKEIPESLIKGMILKIEELEKRIIDLETTHMNPT